MIRLMGEIEVIKNVWLYVGPHRRLIFVLTHKRSMSDHRDEVESRCHIRCRTRWSILRRRRSLHHRRRRASHRNRRRKTCRKVGW